MGKIENTLIWHDKLLQHLLQHREDKPSLKFLVRQINNKNRLHKGYWFNGDDSYIFIGFFDRNGGINKTPSVGFVVWFDEEQTAYSYLEIVFKGEKDKQVIDFYQQAMERIGGFKKKGKNGEKYQRGFGAKNVMESLDEFLATEKPKMDELIEELGLESKLFIEDKKFDKLLQRVLNVRKKKLAATRTRFVLVNITWNSKDWKEVSEDDSGHKWVAGGNIPHESWNFDFNNLRNTSQKVYGYAQFTNPPNVEGDNHLIIFYSQDKIVGFYGKAQFLDEPEELNDQEAYNLVGDRDLSLVLTNKIEKVKEKGYFEDKQRVGQVGFTYLKQKETVEKILDEAITLNPHQADQLKAIKNWINIDDRTIDEEDQNGMNSKNYFHHNLILFGPPGTGKTYHTVNKAIEIVDPGFFKKNQHGRDALKQRFNELLIKDWDTTSGQIAFCTFHQSFSYEDFVEGIKPQKAEENDEFLKYEIQNGIFKNICRLSEEQKFTPAAAQKKEKNFVLIIDEINRGNVSSIFGELITLIEKDKRAGGDEELEVILPYSKEPFMVPSNVYIIGTMNTADRSVEALDTALRRRFSFDFMPPLYDLDELQREIAGIKLSSLLKSINDRIAFLLDEDHQIGHSYLIDVKDEKGLKEVFKIKIIPLLKEYFFNDFGKIRLVLGDGFVEKRENHKPRFATEDEELDRTTYKIIPVTEDFDIVDALKNTIG